MGMEDRFRKAAGDVGVLVAERLRVNAGNPERAQPTAQRPIGLLEWPVVPKVVLSRSQPRPEQVTPAAIKAVEPGSPAHAAGVSAGMELLSVVERGPAPMGFYEKPEQRTPIKAIRLASEVPEKERTPLQLLRTDSKTFTEATEARRNRRDGRHERLTGHARARTGGEQAPQCARQNAEHHEQPGPRTDTCDAAEPSHRAAGHQQKTPALQEREGSTTDPHCDDHRKGELRKVADEERQHAHAERARRITRTGSR